MPSTQPMFSVVIPTIGGDSKLLPLIEGLAAQTLARDEWETIVVFDGADLSPRVGERLDMLGARIVRLDRRQGPSIARNAGAATAAGPFLAFTEDDVVPDPEWLASAALRLAADPSLDVLEGVTKKPGGRAVRIRGDESPQYIPCNLFVRRSLFERIGGYHEGYFDADNGVFFREDADLGFALEGAGARVGREERAIVTHPIEHPRFLDPLRWAKRYEMDALLAKRYPALFRERIEIHELGPLKIRRPIIRASVVYLIGLAIALAGFLAARPILPWIGVAAAAAAFLPIWAKWRFDLKRLPVFLLVPFALLLALLRGKARVRKLNLS